MHRFKHILCLTSGDRHPDLALARAMNLAVGHQAHLTVLEVIDDISWQLRLFSGLKDPEEIERRRREEHLLRLRDKVAAAGATDVAVKVAAGNRHIEELREVVRAGCDLVVAGVAPDVGLNRLFRGDAMRLLRKCPSPLWLERYPPGNPIRRILVAVDVNQDYEPERLDVNRNLNLRLLGLALAQAIADSAELHVVHVWRNLGDSLVNTILNSVPDIDMEHYNAQARESHRLAVEALISDAGASGSADALSFSPPRVHLLEGSPAVEIPALAKRLQSDLVVMGTLARTGVSGLLMGNTSEAIIDQLDCSLLAIKPDDFVSPVS